MKFSSAAVMAKQNTNQSMHASQQIMRHRNNY